MESGDCDGILYDLTSRLTRRPSEYETIVSLVERTGVRLATVVSGDVDLSTSQGRMIGRILSNVDAAEAEQIGERVSRAMQQRREAGKAHTVRSAFGFEPGGSIIIPAQAEAIRLGAQMILDGKAFKMLAAPGARPDTNLRPGVGGGLLLRSGECSPLRGLPVWSPTRAPSWPHL